MASAAAGSRPVAVWLMAETSGRAMIDSSGNGNHGTTHHVVMRGSKGYKFAARLHSKVVVPSSASLNAGARPFSYSVTMKSSHVPAKGTDYDLMRKGIGSTSGGEYKIEIVPVDGQGRAFCVVKDSRGTGARIKGTTNVTNGHVHTLTCTKTRSGVTLQVDALKPRTRTVTSTLGTISNTSALVIGAKRPTASGTEGDWYRGTLLDARIRVG
jgi:hypothetical protein